MADDLERALKTAANIMSYSPRSRAALVARLVEKGFDEQTAADVTARLEELNLLSDLALARSLAESYAARGYGPARIRNALKQKQICADDIDAALDEYTPNEEKIEKYIAARLSRGQIDRKAIKRVSDGLFRRGFDWDDINSAINNYIASLEDEALA